MRRILIGQARRKQRIRQHRDRQRFAITNNRARGGGSDDGGTDGLGVDGGVCNLGTFLFDAATVIAHTSPPPITTTASGIRGSAFASPVARSEECYALRTNGPRGFRVDYRQESW